MTEHTDTYRWEHIAGREVSLHSADRILARYHFAADRGKAYIHPIHTPDGTPITQTEPEDHFWHHGLWFSWKFLDGVNYWEEGLEDRGLTELAGSERVALEESRAVVNTEYLYRPIGAEAVAKERREVSLQLPAADGSIRIDWTLVFTAVKDAVQIDRVPITEETWWGGYAGLGWRAAGQLGSFRAIDSEGRRDDALQHQRARWADLSGIVEGPVPGLANAEDRGQGRVGGVAIFDHPDNPRHPSHWVSFGLPGVGFLNPAFVLADPYNLTADEELKLRYRVLIHPGWGDSARCEQEYQDFASAG